MFEAIARHADEHAFRQTLDNFTRTDVAPGTAGKIAVMRARLEAGEPIHHEEDRADFEGLVGVDFGGKPTRMDRM